LRDAELNNKLVYNLDSLKSDDLAKADFQKVQIWAPLYDYRFALRELLRYLGPVAAPAPPAPPSPPAPTPTGGTLAAAEIKTLQDLNYLARTAYTADGDAKWDRFMVMQTALGNGSYLTWTDANRGELLSLMASTPDGAYPPNLAIVQKFASAIGVVLGGAPVPVVVPTPAPPVVSLPSDLQAALESVGFEFASNGQISGFKLISIGAPEGTFYAYVGASDAGLRLFSGISSMIGREWADGQNTNPNLPVIMGPVTERDGGISWDVIGSSVRKTFVMYLAGFLKGRGPRKGAIGGRFLDFCTFESGRGWRFNTLPR
jgi:hypothetical protein